MVGTRSPGTPVVLEPTDTGFPRRPLEAVMREVQGFFADVAASDVLLSEELIRDRRKEEERDAGG